MHRLLEAQNPSLLEWARHKLQVNDFGPAVTLGLASKEELLAVVVYNHYNEDSIELSIASVSPGWATRRFLKAAFGYPFKQLKVGRVTATARADNKKSIDMLERLGFQLEGRIRRYFKSGEDALIYGLLKEHCRWIK